MKTEYERSEHKSSLFWNSCSSSPEKHLDSFIGSFVRVITTEDVRYQGVLENINVQDCTLSIKNVMVYTEGKNNKGSQVLHCNDERMIFSLSAIEDLNIDYLVGNVLTVITKEDVRVEGFLAHLNLDKEWLIMSEAYCYGTEGRKRRKRSEIAPCKEVAHPIFFRFRDIKDREITFVQNPQVEENQSVFPPLSKTHMAHRPLGRQ